MKRRLREVARFTRQPAVLARFYSAVLDQAVPPAHRDRFNFEIDGVNLFIHAASDEPAAEGWPPDVDHIAFEVEDLDAECARLAALGYQMLGPTDFPWGRAAYVRDPDGRLVELHGPGMVFE